MLGEVRFVHHFEQRELAFLLGELAGRELFDPQERYIYEGDLERAEALV